MAKYLSGRVQRTPQSGLTSDRYSYLSLDQAEPNLGDPAVPGVILPSGVQYQLISVLNHPGERYWIPVGGGLIPGSISVYDEGLLVPPGGVSSITQLNFVGAAISASGYLDSYGNPGTISTITVFAPGNNKELIFNSNNEFSSSVDLTYDVNTGILTAARILNVGTGGTVFSTTGIGSVGIGTTNPTTKLHIVGDLRLTGTIYDYANNPGISQQILAKNSFGSLVWTSQSSIKAGAGGTFNQVQYHNSAGLVDGAATFVYDPITGNVGIGSTLPIYLLDVAGDTRIAGITTLNKLYVTGISTFSSSADSTNTTSGALIITGGVGIAKNLNVGAVISTQSLNVTGQTTTQNLNVVGVSTLFDITGTSANFTGIVTASTFKGQISSGVGTITTFNSTNGTITALTGTAVTYTTGNITTLNGSNLYYNTGIITSLTSTNSSLANIISSGISTLGITTTTQLTARSLNVSGITTTQTLNVSGISTFGGSITPSANEIYNIGNINYKWNSLYVSTIVADQITGNTTTATSVIGGYADITSSNVSGISTTQYLVVLGNSSLGIATATSLSSQYLSVVGVATMPILNSTTGTITTLNGSNAYYNTGIITSLSGTAVTFTIGNIASLSGNNAYYNTGIVTTLSGTNLTYTNGNITTLNGSNAYYNVGIITSLSGTNLTYTNGTISALTGTAATFTTGNITTLSGTNLTYTNGNVTSLTGTAITYTNANFTNLSGGNITYSTTSSNTLLAFDGYINTGIVTTLSGTNLTYTNGNITTLNGSNAYYNVGIVTTLSGTSLTYPIGNITSLISQSINVTGIVTATTFKGALNGNADTATKLTTGRTIAITGDLTYTSPSFDGTANVTATGTLANTGVVANTYGTSTQIPVFAVDSKGRVTSVTNTPISFGAATVASADKLTTGRTIAITGDLTYTSPSFDGTANVTATSTLASTGVVAATYGSSTTVPQIAIDAKGRITSASNVGVNFSAATVASADKLTNGRTIAITGDLTYTSPSFDGTANVTATGTLASTGVVANTYGSGSQVPVFTVDSKGRITSVTNTSITGINASSVAAAGSNTQIQFNDSGVFAGNANLTFNKSTNTFATSIISASNSITAGTNTRYQIGNAYLSSGGDYAHLATHEWYNGSSWQTDSTPGGLFQITGQSFNWYKHNGTATHTLSLNLDSSGNLAATGTVTGTQLISTVATGTAPLSVTSTTTIPNLSAERISDVTGTGSALRITSPRGASYATSSSTVTGAIKIKLPTATFKSNTMMRMTVKIYEYNGNGSGTSRSIDVGGYNYSDAGGNWYNYFATQTTMGGGDINVRFGNDGTSQCIWIGETSTTWYYPQIFVTDFQAGYINYTDALWGSGWTVSITGTLDTVTQGPIIAAKNLTSQNYGSYSTFSGTVTASTFSGSLANTLTLNTSGTGLSGSTTFNNSGAATFTVTSNATSSNTGSTIVARDASGNFSAGTITSSQLTCTGNILQTTGGSFHRIAYSSADNSYSATMWWNGLVLGNNGTNFIVAGRTAVGGSLAFYVNNTSDLTSNTTPGGTLALTLASTGAATFGSTVSATTYTSTVATGTAPLTVSSTTQVTNLNAQYLNGLLSATANTGSTIVARDASGNFSAGTISAALSGNASTATTLQTARKINEVSFNGSSDITIPLPSPGGVTGSIQYNNGSSSFAGSDGLIFSGGNLSCSGDIIAFASDERLKTNIKPIRNAVDKVSKLRGFTYNFNEIGEGLGFDVSKKHAGVSAQEVQAVLPEAVAPAPANDEYLTVKYEKLVPLLIEAIKEQQNQIEDLKSKIK